MDEKQQNQVNEAAEKFADALKQSYQSLADRSVSAQELNAQLTQDFFNGVINNLRTQAESNRSVAGELFERAEEGRDAYRALVEQSLDAYMDLAYAPLAYYKENLEAARKATRG